MESLKKINNLTLHSVTGKVDDSFIGIKIKNSLIDFYFPETYDIAEEHDIVNLRNDIFAILRTISLAKTFTESNEKVENKFSINGQFALMSYLWIILELFWLLWLFHLFYYPFWGYLIHLFLQDY